MAKRYEIVVDRLGWYEDCYVGPWSYADEVTFYNDFKEALELVFEWGRNAAGDIRKNNRIGIYDHKDDEFYSQGRCFKFEDLMR